MYSALGYLSKFMNGFITLLLCDLYMVSPNLEFNHLHATGIQYINMEPYDAHVFKRVAKHSSEKAKQSGKLHCLPCGVVYCFTQEAYDSHIQNQHLNGHARETIKYNRLKQWYCPSCNAQSRSQTEWDNHNETAKHIKGKVEYHCEQCNYKTKLAHLVKQHERTKKHIQKS